MNQEMTMLPADHPAMKAWMEFCSTDEFMNALRWANETKYDDGLPIDAFQREEHAKGSLWVAFLKGLEWQSGQVVTCGCGDERPRGEMCHICGKCQMGCCMCAERIADLERVLVSLKTGTCWCGVGTGNPMFTAHTAACVAATRLGAHQCLKNIEKAGGESMRT